MARVWKDFPYYFQMELQIVFSIVFSTCGHINCDNPNAIANLALQFEFSLSRTHSDCHISNEKNKVHLQLYFPCLTSYEPVIFK